jgi:DUF4097 and DUF4098 domain-containing protein YvlB
MINMKFPQAGNVSLKTTSLTMNAIYMEQHPVIEIQGQLEARNGNTWLMNMVIDEIDLTTNSGNCDTTLTSPGGAVVASDVECSIVLNPITS